MKIVVYWNPHCVSSCVSKRYESVNEAFIEVSALGIDAYIFVFKTDVKIGKIIKFHNKMFKIDKSEDKFDKLH